MPTLSLCVIAKNEEANIENFHASIQGLFDEVIFVDTGSTDRTKERAIELGYSVFDFEWVQDFSKARNFSFSKASCDYIMWLDLDDIIKSDSARSLLHWKTYMMSEAEMWLAPYHYATGADGKIACEFLRERVVKRTTPIEWRYFLHEGLMPKEGYPPVKTAIVKSWAVTHNRTQEDLLKDKGRNLSILKHNRSSLNSRMRYYYGKELFDAGKHVEAIPLLEQSISGDDLEMHDRILAMQYLGYCYSRANSWEQALSIATAGLVLASHRAEFHCLAGDALISLKRHREAMPFFFAALACEEGVHARMNGAIFLQRELYSHHPLSQIVRIHYHLGRFEKAHEIALDLYRKHPDSPQAKALLEESLKAKGLPISIDESIQEVSDIVFTAPQETPQLWDEEALEGGFLGGSETACIHMAQEFKKLFPERRVIVFNVRPKSSVALSGVEYISAQEIPLYFSKFSPSLHIAWRHAHKITKAKTFIWSHDLITPGIEHTQNYEKVLALSEFHKTYLMTLLGLPEGKIHVTRNALDPELFQGEMPKRDVNKIVYSSSPDRGLLDVLNILDLVVKERPDVRLHVFYGLENLESHAEKTGSSALRDFSKLLRDEIKKRDYVVYHGGVSKKDLIAELKTASVWLYPTHFMETFCITALETVACGVYPVARDYGALPNTLSKEIDKGHFVLHKLDPKDAPAWALKVKEALENPKDISLDPQDYAWRDVAKEWAQDLLELKEL